jgi:uncharacterized membrane protein SirB2
VGTSYAVLKAIHIAAAIVSYVLFLLRGIWRFSGSPIASQRWTKIVPHVNDTILLAAALGMAATLAAYPAFHAFLAAKVLGLVVYIVLGMAAFRWAKTRRARLLAWFCAQAVFFYVVAVAITKSPSLGLIG